MRLGVLLHIKIMFPNHINSISKYADIFSYIRFNNFINLKINIRYRLNYYLKIVRTTFHLVKKGICINGPK